MLPILNVLIIKSFFSQEMKTAYLKKEATLPPGANFTKNIKNTIK